MILTHVVVLEAAGHGQSQLAHGAQFAEFKMAKFGIITI